MSLYIPERERSHAVALVSASSDVLNAIHLAISQCDPALLSNNLGAAVAEKLSRVAGVSKATVQSIVRSLVAMYSVLRVEAGLSPAQAAAEAVEALKQGDEVGKPTEGWAAFQKHLEEFFSEDRVLGVSAKAVNVSTDTLRHIHEVRVLTDARPIFGDNVNDGPRAFAIIHTLKIKFYEDDSEHEWYVSLDADDLEELQGAAERALSKEKSLQSALQRLSVPILSWKITSDGE